MKLGLLPALLCLLIGITLGYLAWRIVYKGFGEWGARYRLRRFSREAMNFPDGPPQGRARHE